MNPRGPIAAEGAIASRNPRTTCLSGVADGLVGGSPKGAAVGRFGWADIAGRVRNFRDAETDVRGFVLPPVQLGNPYADGDWQFAYRETDTGILFIRPGLPVTMCSRGDFWARFELGATRGQPVYADPLTGAVISGYADGAELTPWSVVNSAAPGQLAIISTWSDYTS